MARIMLDKTRIVKLPFIQENMVTGSHVIPLPQNNMATLKLYMEYLCTQLWLSTRHICHISLSSDNKNKSFTNSP